MEYTQQLLSYVLVIIAALIPIANPVSTAPLFVSMTAKLSKADRNRVATLATVYMFIILTVFLLIGAFILSFFGISLSALQISGGLIIAYIGFMMLFPKDEVKSETEETTDAISSSNVTKIAFTPLAMPMLSGPGSISVILGVAAQVAELKTFTEQLASYAVVTLGIAISAFICWLVLRASSTVTKFMGVNGIDTLTKIMGFLLISIGVQFIISGVQALMVISDIPIS